MDGNIEWNAARDAAERFERDARDAAAKTKTEYQENLDLARSEMNELISLNDFRGYSHFEDIASNYGVDEEDLIFSMF